MISTLSEFEAQLKGKMFQGHTGVRFAGVLYGVLMRLEGNGVSAQVLDDLLSDAGFKTRGHYSRYLAQGFRYCDDLYAFERLVGVSDIPKEKVKPQFHPNRRKAKGLPAQEKKGRNEILLESPEPKPRPEPEEAPQEADVILAGMPERKPAPEHAPVERPAERPAERPVERPAERPVPEPQKPSGGFQLKRAKKDSEIIRDRQARPMNYSAIEEESNDRSSRRLEESRRAGIPEGARRTQLEGDEF